MMMMMMMAMAMFCTAKGGLLAYSFIALFTCTPVHSSSKSK